MHTPAEIIVSLPALCLCCPASQPFNTRGGPGPPPSANRSLCISGVTKRWTDHRPISRVPLCPALLSSPRSRNWSHTTWRWAQWPPHRRGKPSWVWHSPPRRYIFGKSYLLPVSSTWLISSLPPCTDQSVCFYWPFIAFKVIFQI